MVGKKIMKKIGLFFGTFNPIHNGHLMMANYIVNNTDIDEVKFVVSANAQFKETNGELVDFEIRCRMIEMAIDRTPCLSVEWIEYYMSIIPYTYEVLRRLMNDGNEYKLIIGADNLREIHSWYRIADLLQMVDILVIPRDNIDCISELDEIYREYPNVKNISILDDCPYCTLSSTFVREQVKEGKDISFYVPEEVRKYIKTQMMYADTLICSWDDYKSKLWINFENSCFNKDLVDKLVKYLKDYTNFDDADINGCSVEMGDEDISWSDIGYTKERFEEICNKIGLRISWL